MMKQSLYLALLVPLLASVVGCGGSDGDNVNITNDFVGPIDPVNPNPPLPSGDCAQVVLQILLGLTRIALSVRSLALSMKITHCLAKSSGA